MITQAHTHTVSTSTLEPGDVLVTHGDRIVESVTRNQDNLGAALVRFTDGSFLHVGWYDAWAIARH